MTADAAQTNAGQQVYSPLVLAFYDLWVLGVSNHWLWRCPTAKIREIYDRNVGARHLDIGVGTGYYLDRARWPVAQPAITLLDLNANSLATAAQRIQRYAPRVVVADALRPLPISDKFDSIALCYLLHCLPGSLAGKSAVFDHVRPLMASGGGVFGATIVQGDAPRGRLAQRLMDAYNARGIFSNASDTSAELERELRTRFGQVSVSRQGCVALFEARI